MVRRVTVVMVVLVLELVVLVLVGGASDNQHKQQAQGKENRKIHTKENNTDNNTLLSI